MNGLGSWNAQNVFTPNNPAGSIAVSAINGQSGLLELASPGATLQGAGLNGLLKVTSPYTTAMLNTQNDILRVQVGNAGPNFESGFTNPATAAITAAMRIPSGGYTGANTAGDAAIQAIVINDSTGNPMKSGIALNAVAGIGTSGSFVEAMNSSIVNCATFYQCGGTTGLDFTNFTNIEADTDLYCMTALSNGTCPTSGMPTGPVFGIVSQLNATTQNTGAMPAFLVVGSQNVGAGFIPWKIGFSSLSGAATIGLSLGATSNSNSSNSQNIQLVSINSSGTPYFGDIVLDSAGTMHVGPQNVDLGISYTFPQMQLTSYVASSGMVMSTNQTGPTASQNLDFNTGSGGANASLQEVDGGAFIIATGSGEVGGIVLNPSAGNVTINGAGGLAVGAGIIALGLPSAPASGASAQGSICRDSSGNFYIKTSTGSCV